jgi:hypothetical protein
VRRPLAPCWRATHALLDHLALAGFDGAPRVIEAGQAIEKLTYVEGNAGVSPLPEEMLSDQALASVADLLSRYHRAAASFDPVGYAWPRPVPARYRTGLVSHNDVYPANLVFRGGQAVALIDFDLAGPGSAVWDFAAAARSFVPLLDEADVLDSRQGRAVERFRLLLAASSLTRADRCLVAEAVVANHDWTYAIVTEAAAAGHAGFADHWRAVAPTAARARYWCKRHRRALIASATRALNTCAGYVFGRSKWGPNGTFYSLRFGPGRQVHGHDDHMGITCYSRGRNLIVNAGHTGYEVSPYRTYIQSPEARPPPRSP